MSGIEQCVSVTRPERVIMNKLSKTPKPANNLQTQLEELKQLNSGELRKRWQTLFGSAPPPRLRSSLMVQAIARRLQEKALGGLKPATQQLLHKVAEDASAGRKISATAKKIQPRQSAIRPDCLFWLRWRWTSDSPDAPASSVCCTLDIADGARALELSSEPKPRSSRCAFQLRGKSPPGLG